MDLTTQHEFGVGDFEEFQTDSSFVIPFDFRQRSGDLHGRFDDESV